MKKHTCWCGNAYNTDKGLSIHKTKAGHWGGKPLPIPEKKHVNYMDLVKGSTDSWGTQMTEHEKKHPSIENLKLGALLYIAHLLVQILAELKRPKQIS